MKRLTIALSAALLMLVLSSSAVFAQLSVGGKPISFVAPEHFTQKVTPVLMPFVDIDKLRAEDRINDQDWTKPHRFGHEMNVSLGLDNAGRWTTLPNGDKVWQLAILSPGAQTINLIFSKYYLPEGAQLFIYSARGTQMIGAFTSLNNQPEHQLGTTLVKGDEMIIEYFEPAWVAFPGEVEVGTVVHGYRLPGDGEEKSYGDSGNCHNNVNCPSGAAWADQKRSVAKIVNGGDWCTGALINNTSNNGTPYFLTANHCYSSNYATWVFWFNYESAGCTATGDPAYNSLSGSSLKSRNAASDFMLLQLNSTPPSSFNVYYSGWDRSGTTPTSTTGIHHPSGDIKKISFDNNASTNSNWSGTPANSHWHVIWDSGVTEGGSSGSPLYDQNKRIVGQLHGGASVCGGSDLSDEYGKFSWSWDYGTTTATRLKDWLDPTNTGATTLNGINGASGPYLTVSPSNQNVNSPAGSTTFSVSSNVSWTVTSGAAWITVSPASGSNNGTITATYTANTGGTTRVGTITVTNGTLSQNVTVTQLGASTCSNDSETANNARTTAPTIALNTDKYSQIGSSTDVDYWKFTLGATTTITMTLNNLPADFDLKLLRSNGGTLNTSQNAGTTSETITRSLNSGTYYAYVYGYSGAFSTSQCYILRVATPGGLSAPDNEIELTKEVNEVAIFPNPTTGFTTVRLPNENAASVEVYDQMGRLMQRLEGSYDIQLDLSNYANGVYMVKVNHEGSVTVNRIVLNK